MPRGVQPGFLRPKAPKTHARDVPLATVMDGQTPNSKWWIGEMPTRTGGVCKCWKLFRFDDVPQETVDAMTKDDLHALAVTYLESARALFPAELKDVLKTIEEDTKELEAIKARGTLPSVEYRRAKERRVRDRGGRASTLSGASTASGKGLAVRKTGGKASRKVVPASIREAEAAITEAAIARAAAVQEEQPASSGTEPVHYTPDELREHGLTIEDLAESGMQVMPTPDGGCTAWMA